MITKWFKGHLNTLNTEIWDVSRRELLNFKKYF